MCRMELINHKGKTCPYKPVICQEGFCGNCGIYLVIKDPQKFAFLQDLNNKSELKVGRLSKF